MSVVGPSEDAERLAILLEALASPVRIQILADLRTPRALSEIHVASAVTPPSGPERQTPMSRQGVRKHLVRLEELGIVTRREGTRGAVEVEEYVVNHSRVFAISEALRELARLRPSIEPGGVTLPRGSAVDRRIVEGPRFVVVHGVDDMRPFALSGAAGGAHEDRWTIGRRRDNAVVLDYDPWVSSVHAVVVREGNRFRIEDLPSNQNGTELNGKPVPRGQAEELVNGDLVGVGRTLLLFRAT